MARQGRYPCIDLMDSNKVLFYADTLAQACRTFKAYTAFMPPGVTPSHRKDYAVYGHLSDPDITGRDISGPYWVCGWAWKKMFTKSIGY